jgi:hypothetical protein
MQIWVFPLTRGPFRACPVIGSTGGPIQVRPAYCEAPYSAASRAREPLFAPDVDGSLVAPDKVWDFAEQTPVNQWAEVSD